MQFYVDLTSDDPIRGRTVGEREWIGYRELNFCNYLNEIVHFSKKYKYLVFAQKNQSFARIGFLRGSQHLSSFLKLNRSTFEF